MTRRNKPRLIDPALDIQAHELRQLGVVSAGQMHRANERAQRGGLAQPRKAPIVSGGHRDGTALASLLGILAGQGVIRNQAVPGDLLTTLGAAQSLPAVKIATAVDDDPSAFDTSIDTLLSVSVGPLTTGISYLLLCLVFGQVSVDSTGVATLYARTQSSSSSVAGQSTGTVDGERPCVAVAFETVTGTGSSVTMSGRGKMDTGTGTANSLLVVGLALPLGLTTD